MHHIALIPAKKNSSRCLNKNWRTFIDNKNLVEYTINSLPKNFFYKVIVSTDNNNFKKNHFPNIIIHKRNKKLAEVNSDINELIPVIISEYKLKKDDFLWLLNPTSPLRLKKDFLRIKKIIKNKKPKTIISVTKSSPYVWKNNLPTFVITSKRKNTQDMANYSYENGMFYVFKVKDYLKNHIWYNNKTLLLEINNINGLIDIDCENDFLVAQKTAEFFIEQK